MFNFSRYTALLLEVFVLQQQLQKDPPDDPVEYMALVVKIESLMNQAAAMLHKSDGGETITREQIRELRDIAHRQNQTRSKDDTPAVFEYDTVLSSAPDESRLKSGDPIYGNHPDPAQAMRWIVWGGVGRTPKSPQWHLLKTMP